MRQRKLFPALPQNIQKPLYCPGSCFSFTDFEHLSQRPQPQDSDNLYGNPNGHPSSYWFLLIALLAVFFLLVSYYVIISDCCSDLCHPRSREAQPERPDDSFADENGVDRPISFIPTVGLQLSQINSIKVRRFKKGDGLIEGTDCSVCLNEYLEGEMLRLLPKCGHAFHVSCIDSWLRSHSNCPLCRARIVSDAIAAASTPSYRISDNLDTTTGGGGGREFRSIQRRHSDVAAGTEELHDFTEPKEGLSTCEKEDTFATNRDHNVPYFPRRKSVSLDSSASAALLRGLEDSYDLDFDRSFVENDVGNGKSDSQNRPVQDEPSSSSSHQFLRPSPGRMNERSFSCSGRFFTSKRSRNHFLRTP